MAEPALEITMNGESFIATRRNTALFTFLGEMAVYDHIFLMVDEAEGTGGYLFKNQAIWADMAGFLIEHEFPLHLNQQEVADCDVRAFDATMYGDVRTTETFPQAWVKDEQTH